MTVVLFVLASMLPPLSFEFVLRGPEWLGSAWDALRGRRRQYVVRPPSGRLVPIERLAADLHRLSQEIDLVAAAPRPFGRMLKLRATTLAYDSCLVDACALLGVDAPREVPLADADRLAAEASLALAGLRW